MMGFAAEETLLYSPELKFYGNRVKMDKDFNTNMKGLHCLGKFQRMKQGIDDGIRHGSAGGAE